MFVTNMVFSENIVLILIYLSLDISHRPIYVAYMLHRVLKEPKFHVECVSEKQPKTAAKAVKDLIDVASPLNSASSVLTDSFLQLLPVMFLVSSRFRNEPKNTYMPKLRNLMANINLFQLKGQYLVLSYDLHVSLQMMSVSHFEFHTIVTFQHVSALH